MTTTAGKLASANLAAGVDTLLYTAPAAGATVTVDVNFCNRNVSAVNVRLYRGFGAAPDPTTDAVTYDRSVARDGNVSGLVLSPSEKLWVRSDTANVTAICQGFPEVLYAI